MKQTKRAILAVSGAPQAPLLICSKKLQSNNIFEIKFVSSSSQKFLQWYSSSETEQDLQFYINTQKSTLTPPIPNLHPYVWFQSSYLSKRLTSIINKGFMSRDEVRFHILMHLPLWYFYLTELKNLTLETSNMSLRDWHWHELTRNLRSIVLLLILLGI